MKPSLVLGGVVAAALLCLEAAARPPQDGLVDELQDVLRALRDERAEAYARRRARDAEIEAARAPLRRLEGEVAELKAKEGEADKALAEARAEIATLRKAADAEAENAKLLQPEVESTSAAFRALVEKGIPYRIEERLARLGPSTAPLPERVNRLWAFAQEELRIARSGEAWSAEVALPGGRAKPARLFRTGHLLCGFVTEDGLETGLWKDGWTDGAGPEVRQAVEMIDRRRAPALLLFPIEGRASK